jgi:hypothetical protein
MSRRPAGFLLILVREAATTRFEKRVDSTGQKI